MYSRLLVGTNGNPVWCKYAEDDRDAAALEREVAVLEELDGAGVVELVDSGDRSFSSLIVGSRTLGEMATSGQLTRAAADAALAALDEIHRSGWLHGRPTLDHAVLGASGRVRWCSLRSARRVDSPADPAIRRERQAVEAAFGDAGIDPLPRRGHPVPGSGHRGTGVDATPRRTVRRASRRRRAMASGVSEAVLFVVIALVVWRLVAGREPTTALDSAVIWCSRIAVVIGLYGAVASTTAVIADGLRRGDVANAARRALPRWLRWGAAGTTALSLAASLSTSDRPITTTPTKTGPTATAPTSTTPTTTTPTTTTPTTTATTTTSPITSPTATPPPGPAPSVAVVVAPGDHLWGIAGRALADRLGRTPTEREVARYWLGMIELNRTRLVDPDNPDLIFPGQEFELPSS